MCVLKDSHVANARGSVQALALLYQWAEDLQTAHTTTSPSY